VPCIDLVQTVYAEKGGRLATPGRTEKAEELTAAHVELEPLKRAHFVERLADIS
jgi:hypothetical protein